MRKQLVILFIGGILNACTFAPNSLGPTPTATVLPTKTYTPFPTSTPTVIPTPTIVATELTDEKYSNVYGRVLWQGKPVPDFKVDLSVTGFEYYGQTSTTDDNGRFVFTRVPPGDGSINGDPTGNELDGIAGTVVMEFSVPKHANLNVGEYYLIATNLKILEPERDAELSEPPTSLSWEVYPGADHYLVEMIQEPWTGSYSNIEITTTETQITIDRMLACTYYWDVTAYDVNDIAIARSDFAHVDKFYEEDQRYDGIFTISNDNLSSCHISVLSPDYGTYHPGRTIEFRWELMPLATKYQLILGKYIGPLVKDTVYDGYLEIQADGSFKEVKIPDLGVGTYDWTVYAYAADGVQFAHSQTYRFYIE